MGRKYTEANIPALIDRLKAHQERRGDVVAPLLYRLADARGRMGVQLACSKAEAAAEALEKEAKTLAKVAREDAASKGPAPEADKEITKPVRVPRAARAKKPSA